jgi:predicted  nucleic acid-binding Zn-ribbon protein
MLEIKSAKSQINDLQNQINNNNLNGDVKENIITKLEELKNYLNTLNSKHKEYLRKFEKGEVNLTPKNSASIYEQYKDTFSSTFAKVESKADEIADLINNSSAPRPRPASLPFGGDHLRSRALRAREAEGGGQR